MSVACSGSVGGRGDGDGAGLEGREEVRLETAVGRLENSHLRQPLLGNARNGSIMVRTV